MSAYDGVLSRAALHRHRVATRRCLALALSAALLMSSNAHAADTSNTNNETASSTFRLTPLWALTQLIPSPGARIDGEGVFFSGQWQVTPLSYAWGVHRRGRQFRTLAVPPIARHGGSVELHLTPEIVSGRADLSDLWLLAAGTRAYFPLIERGEYLSLSIGGSVLTFREELGAAYDIGVYTLGLVGIRVTVAPTQAVRSFTVTAVIRPF